MEWRRPRFGVALLSFLLFLLSALLLWEWSLSMDFHGPNFQEDPHFSSPDPLEGSHKTRGLLMGGNFPLGSHFFSIQILSEWGPRLFLLRGFFSSAECDSLLRADRADRLGLNKVVPQALELLSSFVHVPDDHTEPLQMVVIPEKGTESMSFFVDFDDTTFGLMGQRLATLLWCLGEEAKEGGESATLLSTHSQSAFHCHRGDVFVVFNTLPGLQQDTAATFRLFPPHNVGPRGSVVGVLHFRQQPFDSLEKAVQ